MSGQTDATFTGAANGEPDAAGHDTEEGTTLAPARPELPGLKLLKQLGRGGTGVVYEAFEEALRRHVAVKIIREHELADDEQRKQFLTEAFTLSTFTDPHVVAIYNVGTHNSCLYYTMELMNGRSLAELINRQPQPAQFAAHMVMTLASAVHRLHQRGVIHRDLKPANVLLTAFPRSHTAIPGGVVAAPNEVPLGDTAAWLPKIADFGLAKHVADQASTGPFTTVVGTPQYMAPEQFTALRNSIGPCSDVYALGVILYEMLTGRAPFSAETPLALMTQVLGADPDPPSRHNPSVPRDLETICLKCLHRKAARRYTTAAALAEDLGRFLKGDTVLARPIGMLARAGRWCKRRWVAVAAVGVLALIALAFGAGLHSQGNKAHDTDQVQEPTLPLYDDFASVALNDQKWTTFCEVGATVKVGGAATLFADGGGLTGEVPAILRSRAIICDDIEFDFTPHVGAAHCSARARVTDGAAAIDIVAGPSPTGATVMRVELYGYTFLESAGSLPVVPDTVYRIKFVSADDGIHIFRNRRRVARVTGTLRPRSWLEFQAKSDGILPHIAEGTPIDVSQWNVSGDVDQQAGLLRLWMYRDGTLSSSSADSRRTPNGTDIRGFSALVDRLGDKLPIKNQAVSLIALTDGTGEIGLRWHHDSGTFGVYWTGTYGQGDIRFPFRRMEGDFLIREEGTDLVVLFNGERLHTFNKTSVRRNSYFKAFAEGRVGDGGRPLNRDYAIRIKSLLVYPRDRRHAQLIIDNVRGNFDAADGNGSHP